MRLKPMMSHRCLKYFYIYINVVKCDFSHIVGNIMKTGKNKFFLKHTCDEHYAILQEQLLEISKSRYLLVKKFVEEHAHEY